MAEFHAGDDAVPHFGDFVGQNVVVVLVLLDVPVQPQRIQEAVACAFLDTHQFGDAGYGDDLVLNKVLQKLQGGFDIIGVILNKYFNIKTASTMALIDVFVLVFQIKIENLMFSIYGVVMIFITSYMVNLILTKENNEVKIMIFSKKEDEIQDMLLHERDCGCSILHGETGYTKEKMRVIVSIMPYDKVNHVKQSILAIDQDAFIVLENVQAAYSGVHYLRKPEEM